MTDLEKDAHVLAFHFLAGTEHPFIACDKAYAERVFARAKEIVQEVVKASDSQGVSDG